MNKTEISEKTAMTLVQDLYDESPEDFLLIDVGANDGYCADRMWNFILKNDPNAVLIESLPDYFEALQHNYHHLRNIKFENIAISDIDGTNLMTYIPRQEIQSGNVRFRLEDSPHLWKEHWAGGLGSFYLDKNNLADPNIKIFQREILVETRTISYIIEKYRVYNYKNVVVQTDCEGHDLVILRSFPFDHIKPQLYFSEIYGKTRYPPSHPNFGTNKGMYTQDDELETKRIFEKHDYEVYQTGDTLAIQKNLLTNYGV